MALVPEVPHSQVEVGGATGRSLFALKCMRSWGTPYLVKNSSHLHGLVASCSSLLVVTFVCYAFIHPLPLSNIHQSPILMQFEQ